MAGLSQLIENNRQWAREKKQGNPDFFTRYADQQTPDYMWIGCADSRVPETTIVGLEPGDIFVHRNVANIVNPADPSLNTALTFAVTALKVKHIIVCGHYRCGGVKFALESGRNGLFEHWLAPVHEALCTHHQALDAIKDETKRVDHLCELNVKAQVKALSNHVVVKDALKRGQALSVHGLIYDITDGHLHEVNINQ